MSMKHKQRHFTVIVIPHNEESVLSIRIPLFFLQLLGMLIVVALMISFVVMRTYHNLRDENINAEVLRAENRQLAEQLDLLAGTTEQLLVKVEQIEDLGEEVRRLAELPVRETEKYLIIAVAGNNQPRILADRSGNQVVDRAVSNLELLQESLPRRMEDMLHLKEDLLQYRQKKAATPSIWPVAGTVTSEFGPRRSPFSGRRQFHDGIDIAAPQGTPVYAAADGSIVFAAYQRGIGNVIILDHENGLRTLYGHLSGYAVSAGGTVVKGQLIGYIGSTGMSTGPHLHYAIYINNVAVNPREYMP